MNREMMPPPDGGSDQATADRWSGGPGPDKSPRSGGIDGVLIDRIADWLMSSARCDPLGAHRLRGVGAPVEVFAPC